MNDRTVEEQIRPFIIDSLMSQNGKVLTPEIISATTTELIERIMDVVNKEMRGF